jgi:hypothetical protein
MLQITASLFTAQVSNDGPTGRGREGEEEDAHTKGRHGSLDVSEMVRLDDIHAARTHAQQQSRSLLARLLEALATRTGDAGADDDDWDDDDSTGDRKPGRKGASRFPYARDTVPGLDRAFRTALLRWTAAEPTESTVSDAASFLELSLRGLLDADLRFTRMDQSQLAARFTDAGVLTLQHAFSIEGIESGMPVGWFIGAWCRPELRDVVCKVFRDEKRMAALLSHAAAVAVRSERSDLDAPTLRLAHVFAGLRVVTGKDPLDDPETSASTTYEAIEHMGSGLLLTAAEMLDRLLNPLDDDALPVLRAARLWAPVLRPNAKTLSVDDFEPALRPVVRRILSGRAATLTHIDTQPDGAYCGGCSTRLSEQQRQAVLSGATPVASCETCGQFLIPFQHNNSVTRQVLTQLLPDLQDD